MSKAKRRPAKGWKRFGHRSHVGGSRMRLDDERLQADARRLDMQYTTKPGTRRKMK